ncbi:MAG: (d)CMP kinase [Deltaproteobacteria bacterium]|nr:(d)CMP kinase [Deltaproteobacteria bacterium]
MMAVTRKGPVIAIDGPAGSGKSSVSRLLAQRLGLDYIDTGAMYRAIALAMHDDGVDTGDDEAVRRFCSGALIEYSATDGSISVNRRPYSAKIRTEEAATLASVASQKAPVRGLLAGYQRTLGGCGGVVMEGRDIGTVVFPDADIKFFIDASPEVRAGRREKELQAHGMDEPLVSRDMEERDRRDASRTNSPLKRAEDSIYIDTSSIGIDGVVEAMLQMVRERLHA